MSDYDVLNGIITWEEEGMDEDDEAELFQHLIDSGRIHGLQGCYGRRLTELVFGGVVNYPGRWDAISDNGLPAQGGGGMNGSQAAVRFCWEHDLDAGRIRRG